MVPARWPLTQLLAAIPFVTGTPEHTEVVPLIEPPVTFGTTVIVIVPKVIAEHGAFCPVMVYTAVPVLQALVRV